MGSLVATSSLLSRVIEFKGRDTEILSIKDQVRSDTGDEGWAIKTDGCLWYRGWVAVPKSVDLREKILMKFHCSHFFMHQGGTKMYHDLLRQYYWSRMKKHVRDFVRRCLTCQ